MKKDVRTATEVDVFVGAKLKALRKSVKLSQTDLANKVGITFQQIQKYERGVNRIGASRLWGFCQALNVKPGYFFEGLEAHLEQDSSDLSNAETIINTVQQKIAPVVNTSNVVEMVSPEQTP